MRIGVIDYGVGNLGSVARALDGLAVSPVLVNKPSELAAVDALVLPGVGNFGDCRRMLDAGGWVGPLRDQVRLAIKPLLGVCVGMQLLATFSTEGAAPGTDGRVEGLDLIAGRVVHLGALGCGLRVPHVGWNEVTTSSISGRMFDGLPDGTDFYFVHSYAFVAADPADAVAVTDYGIPITAAVRHEHVWGTQFHPEKSSRAGLRLLGNFVEAAAC